MAMKKLTIEMMQELAIQKGGKCLSTEYTNSWTKLTLECGKKHIFKMCPSHIRHGEWCPKCFGRGKTIKDMEDFAKNNGGECLSSAYLGMLVKHQWKCLEGHTWWATPAHIQQGEWCPECCSGINERRCRLIFESLLGVALTRKRPKWLKNNLGRLMELDGYNDELKLAFEYQGIQHYKEYPLYFHKESGIYAYSLRKDEEKRTLCKNNGIVLVEVPYIIKPFEMKDFIIEELILNGFWNKINFDAEINFSRANISKEHQLLDEIKKICIAKSGECLTEYYTSSKTKVKVICNNGHIWESTPGNIKSGYWCPECFNSRRGTTRKLTMGDMHALAKKNGGEFLSLEYINNSVKHIWKCSKNHIWEALPGNVKAGHWCPICARKICGDKLGLSIDNAQELAKCMGGWCLSAGYTNDRTKLEWKCSENHVWFASYADIRRGRWCHICSRKNLWNRRRYNLEYNRGGDLLWKNLE